MKKILSLITMMVLIFSMVSPSYANAASSSSKDQKENPGMAHLSKSEKKEMEDHLKSFSVDKASNKNELSKEKRQVAKEALENSKGNPAYAAFVDGKKTALYNTKEKDQQVAITDGVVEVVERVDKNTFLINGEKHTFNFTVTEEKGPQASSSDIQPLATNGWIEVDYKSGPWEFYSGKWVNVQAQRDFYTYTAGALGSILGSIIGGVMGWAAYGVLASGVGIGAAYNYAASSEYPTNVGKSYVSTYRNGPIPLSDKRVMSSDYAVYYGSDKHLGFSYSYYASCVGCGVL